MMNFRHERNKKLYERSIKLNDQGFYNFENDKKRLDVLITIHNIFENKDYN